MTYASRMGPVLLDDGLAAWTAGLNGLSDYWRGVARRGVTPAGVAQDGLRWLEATTRRGKPSWSLPHEVVLETPVARLRDFTQGSRADVVPTLVLPPQAGHDSCIVDYAPTQSQVGEIRGAGLERVLSLDWKGAGADNKDVTIEDYVHALDRAVAYAGGRVNLVGDCQGGWLAALWAALRPDAVNTLTIAGAPIDFHAGDGAIAKWVEACTPHGSMAFYEALVASGHGVLPGRHMLNGFILIGPQNEVSRQVGLLSQLHDERAVERYRQFEDWFKHTQDIPGAFYLWIVEKLFRDNLLLSGRLEVAGRRVDLRAIDCPLFLLAGSRDHITPPEQVWALEGATSTPRDEVERRLCGAGHLGLFMGREALREQWGPMMREVAARS
jgi:poly(3-hydroxybutyrate) depolymerase